MIQLQQMSADLRTLLSNTGTSGFTVQEPSHQPVTDPDCFVDVQECVVSEHVLLNQTENFMGAFPKTFPHNFLTNKDGTAFKKFSVYRRLK